MGNNNNKFTGSLKSIPTIGEATPHELTFQFNPASISEDRKVDYNFSSAQGQSMPLAQFGAIGNTKISFDLFMYDPKGLDSSLKSLRRLTLPRQVSRLTYYEQFQPHKYFLCLGSYGTFVGVVTDVNISTRRFGKKNFGAVNLSAGIEFVVVSQGHDKDVGYMKRTGGL